jgi:D-alanyl-D-alanine carboxypeptidase
MAVAEPLLAEGTLSALIAALNQPDPARFEAFVAERSAIAGGGPRWMSFRRGYAPISLAQITASETCAVTAIIHDHWDRWLEIKLRVEEDAPHRIVAANVTPVPQPDAAMPARVGWPKVRRALEAKIAADADGGWFCGALMVTRHGQTLFQAAYGLADREAQIPNTLDTRFRMGSMNKMITGVAVLQLAQTGLLGLDDTVGRRLPDYPNARFAETVTIRHLLNHTAGAGDFFGPEFREHRLELRDPGDYIALLGDRAPEFEPGARYKYANYGFIVLGRIVERASGQSYDDYVAANIFSPAGMGATGALPEDIDVPGRAAGYMDGPAGTVRNNDTLPYRGTPAGGGYSTIGDLVRFAHAFTSGKLLDASHMQLVGAGGVEAGPGARYGAGFIEVRESGARSLGHTGGAPGMNGTLLMFPDAGYVVVALSNGDPPQASSLGSFIGQRLPLD